jgi:hypothetical protein
MPRKKGERKRKAVAAGLYVSFSGQLLLEKAAVPQVSHPEEFIQKYRAIRVLHYILNACKLHINMHEAEKRADLPCSAEINVHQ